MIKNTYHYFENAIDSDICKKIIDLGYKKEIEESKINFEMSTTVKPEIRKSFSSQLNDQWIYDLLYPYLHTANENAGWNFDIDYSENLQFTVYKTNNYYNWHKDSGIDASYAFQKKGENYDGKMRKISMTLVLNDSKEYEGGDLEFYYGKHHINDTKDTIEICKVARSKGTLVFFPSFLPHRITPIIKGTRYSLVMWTMGNPFR